MPLGGLVFQVPQDQRIWPFNDLVLYLKTTVEWLGGGRSQGASWTCMKSYQVTPEIPMWIRLNAQTKPTLETRSSKVLRSFFEHDV